MQPRTQRHMRWAVLALVMGLVVLTSPAWADEPGESEESAQLVREAIALIVNTPDDMAAIDDKVVDAQEAPIQGGVDLELVSTAEELLGSGDMHGARAALERSVGAQPHDGRQDPLPIRQSAGGMDMATGAETGTDITADELPTDGAVSGGDWLALSVLLLVGGLGFFLARRPRRGNTGATT